MQETIVLSLGGSLIYPKNIDVAYLKKFRALILSAVAKGKRFGIVCGGGFIAREYIKKANEIISLHPEQNDNMGISLTLANAQLVRELFGDIAYHDVLFSYDTSLKTDKPIIVGGGWKPGCSTDTDAVLLALQLCSKTLINLTNVDYVYTKDPKKSSDAVPIKRTTWKEFKKIVGGEWKAGMNLPFDPLAATLAEKNGLRVIVLNGKKLDNLEKCLEQKEFVGTLIQ